MTETRKTASRIMEAEDALNNVRHLVEALFLAASGLGDRGHTNAIQAVCDEIEAKLVATRDQLEEIRSDLQ